MTRIPPDNASRAGERGNVFFIVLLGVVLFGALMFTFSRSARQGGESMSDKQAEFAAIDILGFSQKVETAVQRVLASGISENDLSFDDGALTGYNNLACTDGRCKVFDMDGGKLVYLAPERDWLVSSYSGNAEYGKWIFAGETVEIQDVGTTGGGASSNDIVMFLRFLKPAVCREINKKLLGSEDVGEESGATTSGYTKFTGSFSGTPQTFDHSGAATIDGLNAGCFCDGASNACPNDQEFVFFRVLSAR